MKTEYGMALPNRFGNYIIQDGEHEGKRVDILTYESFYNVKIEDGYVLHHINDDKSDNDINNLVLMTDNDHKNLHKVYNYYKILDDGVDDAGNKLYSLYAPDGKKIKSSTDKDKLEKDLKKREQNDLYKETVINEKGKHIETFEKYYEMGAKRTLTELSKETGFAESTLSRWNNTFNWENKILERDKGMTQMLARDRIEANIEVRGIYQDTIRQIMKEQVIEPLMNGTLDIQVKNVSDIKRLIEIDTMLSEKDKIDESNSLSQKDKDVIDLVENDKGAWEMLTKQLINKQNSD